MTVASAKQPMLAYPNRTAETAPNLPKRAPGTGVFGYWLIKDTKTGHAALITAGSPGAGHAPVVPNWVKDKMGAGHSDYFTSWYLGGAKDHILSNLENGLGHLQVSSDQIPSDYTKLFQTGLQPLNFDLLTPVGVDPNKYQQATADAGSAAQQTVTSAASLAGLFGSLGFWKGIGLVLAGAVILIFAAVELLRMTGGNVPVGKIVRAVK